MNNKIRSLIPLLIFSFILVPFIFKLTVYKPEGREEFFEKSAMVGKEMPKFTLPSVRDGHLGLNYNDFKGKYSLINFFASWCVACRIEHPLLLDINNNNIVPVYGIVWNDTSEAIQRWLEVNDNPYTKIGVDKGGKIAISFGLTGAPESFLVNKEGIIIYHHVGPLDEHTINNKIIPLIQ